MLKIKDDVDLNKLEKFGFIFCEEKYEPCILELQDDIDGAVRIRITNDKILYPVADLDIYNLGNENEFRMHDIIYDLIKAGLVEKVDDK